MKKKLTLILSIVLVLTVAVCAVLFATANSEPADHFAQVQARERWNAAKNYWSTSVTINNNTISAGSSGKLSELNGVTGANADSTYTYKDGILTLSGSGETVTTGLIKSDGALWIVLDDISTDGQIRNHEGFSVRHGSPYPAYDMPLIISSPIDSDRNVLPPNGADNVGGYITCDGSASNNLRNSGSIIVFGHVGFKFGNGTGSGDTICCYSTNTALNNAKTVSLILAPGLDSYVKGAVATATNVRDIQASSTSRLYIYGSVFNDDPVNISVQNRVEATMGMYLDDNAYLTVSSTNANIVAPTGGIDLKNGAKLVVNSALATPITLPADSSVGVDATSTFYYESVTNSIYTYTFPVAGNYKVGDDIFTVEAGSKLTSATDLSLVRTSNAATVSTITHINTSGVKSVYLLPADGQSSILDGTVSYDATAKTVTLNGVTGNSLHFNILGDFFLNVTGDNNVLGTETQTYVVQSTGSGSMTVTGTGKLSITAKGAALVAQNGSYTQSGATINIHALGGNAIWGKNGVTISGGNVTVDSVTTANNGVIHSNGAYVQTGGTVNVTAKDGSAGNALRAVSVSISQASDKNPTTLKAYALGNASHAISATNDVIVDGGEVVAISQSQRAISSDKGSFILNGGKVSTYGDVNGTEITSKYGIYVTNIKVAGGTADVKIRENSAFVGTNSILIEGGTVTSISGRGSLYAGKSIGISGGTVTATAQNSADAITCNGTVEISGGKVTATAPSRGIYSKGAITVSGGEVTATGTSAANIGVVQSDASYTQTGGTVTITAKDGSEGNALRTPNIAVSQTAVLKAYALDTDSATNHAIVATSNMTVDGGEVVAISKNQRAISVDEGNGIGTLTINGGKIFTRGIVSETDITSKYGVIAQNLVINNGTVEVTSVTYAIEGKQSMKISGGTVTATIGTSGKGIIAGKDLTISGGKVHVISETTGGAVNVAGTLKISSEQEKLTHVTVEAKANAINGNCKLIVSGEEYSESAQTGTYVKVVSTADHGLRVKDIEITGGTVDVTALSYAIRGSNSVAIFGGNVKATNTNGGEGIRSDETLSISGGTISVKASNNAISANKGGLTISGGTITVTSDGVGINVGGAKSEKDSNNKNHIVEYYSGNLVVSGGTLTIDAKTGIIVNNGNVDIQNGNVTITANDGIIVGSETWKLNPETGNYESQGYYTGNVVVSGGTLTMDTASGIVVNNGNVSVNGGEVNISSSADYAIYGKNVTVQGGKLHVEGGSNTAMFGIKDGAEVNLIGGEITGVVGYFLSYNNNNANKINVQNGAFIDVFYTNASFKNGGADGTLNESVPADIWLEGCSWNDEKHWLTTKNWVETSVPRVVLTLKDNSLFGLTLVVGGNRFYPDAQDPLFTLSATGALINLKGTGVAEGEILKIKANGDLSLDIPAGSVVNVGSDTSTSVLDVFGSLTVTGEGTLKINAKSDGIVVGDSYTQTGGTVNVTAKDGSAGNALRAVSVRISQASDKNPTILKAYALGNSSHAIVATDMTVDGGEVVAISQSQRAISSDKGSFILNGGKVSTYGDVNGTEITSKYGIYVTNIKVTGGTADVKIRENSAFVGRNSVLIEGGTVTSISGRGSLYAGKSIGISGGEVTATAQNSADAITCNGTVEISGGKVTATAPSRGIYSKGAITVSGGEVTATGTSAANIGVVQSDASYTQTGGTVTATALDGSDGHALKATDITIDQDAVLKAYALDVNSGSNHAIVTTDMTVNGGEVVVISKHQRAVSGTTFTLNGGKISTYGNVNGEDLSTQYGIYVQDIKVTGGTVDVKGLQNSAFVGTNSILIEGGTVTSISARGSIHSNKLVQITGGNVTAIATTKDNAITCGDVMEISGGAVNVDAPATGIKVNSKIDISGGVVTVNAGGRGIDAGKVLNITGGKVTVTGTNNPALCAVEEVNISNQPGSFTYVDVSANANAISGNDTTINISGDVYDVSNNTGTYVKVASMNDYGLRTKYVNISGGTVEVISTSGNAINTSEDLTISGGVVSAVSKTGRSMNAKTITISDATVNTFLEQDGETVLSRYGITSTVNDLVISGSTVNADVAASHALYSMGKDMEITDSTITAKANGNVVVLNQGNLKISDNGSLDIEARTGAYGVSVGAAITEKDPETGKNVTVGYQPCDVIVSSGTLIVNVANSGRGIQINNGDLKVTGGNVVSNVKNDNGIEANNVLLESGSIEASANTWNGIRAKESVVVSGGTLKVSGNANGALVSPEVKISGKDTVVDLTGKANVLSGGAGTLTITDGNVTVNAQADNAIRVANIAISGGNVTVNAVSWSINGSEKVEISGGNVFSNAVSGNAIYGGTYTQTGGTVIPLISGSGYGIRANVLTVSDGVIRTYQDDVLSTSGIYGNTELEISGGTIDVNISGNYGIAGKTVKLYQKSNKVPTNISATASIWVIFASSHLEIDGLTIEAVAKTGRAIQSNGSIAITDSNITASAVRDIAIEGVDIVVENSVINAQANSGKAVYAKSSLEISGGEFTATMKNTSAIVVDGELVIRDKAIVNVTANDCRATGGALYAYSFYMFGEKGDKGPQVNVTMNSAEFKKGELRQIRAVQIGTPTYAPGEAVLEGGNLKITINNNYADPEFTYNKKTGDVSTNRSVGLFLFNLKSVDFAGTNVVVDLNTQLNNYKTSGFMWVSGSIPTKVTVSDGDLMCDGNGDVQAMFFSEVNESTFDLVGGKITGAAKNFWYSERLNQIMTVKPGVSIDFYNYSGRSVYLGRTNAYNGTTPSWFEDDGVEYLRGCSLKNNSQYLTTGTDELATHVEILVQEGDTEKTYVLNQHYPLYPANADPATAQAYFTEGGEVILNNLKANQIRSNGRVTLNLKGVNTVSAEGQHRIRSMGDIVIGGDGVLNVTGTTYVIYSYRGDEIVVKDKAQLNVVATTGCGIHMNHNDTLSTAVTITDDAKVKVESVGQPIYIRGIETSVNINGNATVEFKSKNNYGISAYGNTAEGIVHKATINIGDDAKVLFNGKSGIYANAQIATININGNAVVDMNCVDGYPFNAVGANPNVNISGKAKVNVLEGCKDVFNLNSNQLAMEGVKQEASVNIFGKASFVNEHAVNCAARINVSAKNADGKTVPGNAIFHVSEQGFADLNSDGQTVYLMATATDSVAALKVTDKANLNVSNLSDTGYAAVQLHSMNSNVEITTKGTVNVTGKVPGGTGAVRIAHPNGGKNVILIKDATFNVTNIQNTEKETLNAAGTNTFAGDRSIAVQINSETEMVIGGNAVVNLHAERNGKKYANTAYGLFITGTAGASKITIQDRAKLNCSSGGDANMNLGTGMFIQNCDVVVTDNATVRSTAQGTSTAGFTFAGTSNLTIEKYGMAYMTGESNKSFGITGYNAGTKGTVTVTDGGRIFASGAVAVNLKTGSITFTASEMEAGKTEEELAETKLDLLNRNYAKYGYVVLKGEMENPRTSDAMLTTVITLTVLVAAAAVAVTVIRKKKSKAN